MRKDIFKVIIHLIFVIIFIFLSIPLWNKIRINSEFLASVVVNNNEDIKLYVSNNKLESDNNHSIVYLYNKGIKDQGAALIFTYQKSSTVDYQSIKLKINEQIVNLKDLYFDENETEVFFLIDQIILSKKENIKYEIDILNSNNNQGEDLDYYYSGLTAPLI